MGWEPVPVQMSSWKRKIYPLRPSHQRDARLWRGRPLLGHLELGPSVAGHLHPSRGQGLEGNHLQGLNHQPLRDFDHRHRPMLQATNRLQRVVLLVTRFCQIVLVHRRRTCDRHLWPGREKIGPNIPRNQPEAARSRPSKRHGHISFQLPR